MVTKVITASYWLVSYKKDPNGVPVLDASGNKIEESRKLVHTSVMSGKGAAIPRKEQSWE